MCTFAREVMRAEAGYHPGHYAAVHSHYWLSGQVGALTRDRWGVPLVHSMHTMAKVKNEALAEGDTPEPVARVIGEEQVVEAADMLIANTDIEAKQLINLYDAEPGRVEVVHPGVDLSRLPAGRQGSRPGPARPPRGRPRADVRRADPAAQGPRRPAPRGRRTPRPGSVAAQPSRRPHRRWPLRHRARAPRGAGRPGRRAGHQRRGPLRPAGHPGAARRVGARGHPGRRALLQRVVRPGRGRGPGHRHAGRGRRGRRPADRRPPRPLRPAGRRPTSLATGRPPSSGSSTTRSSQVNLSLGALEQARHFSWERTAERTLEVYEQAARLMRQEAMAHG